MSNIQVCKIENPKYDLSFFQKILDPKKHCLHIEKTNNKCNFCFCEIPSTISYYCLKLNDEYSIEWRIKHNDIVRAKQTIAELLKENDRMPINSPVSGQIDYITNTNDSEKNKTLLFSIKEEKSQMCHHETVFNNLCISCGKKPEDKKAGFYSFRAAGSDDISFNQSKSVNMVNSYIKNLKEKQKLIIILDLDHTLLHAIEKSNIPQDEISVYLKEFDIRSLEFHHEEFFLKLRPYLISFIQDINPFYDFFIYTMGTRDYAKEICKIISKESGIPIPENRIVAREDNNGNALKSLEKILPFEEKMILIVDDKEDVWREDQRYPCKNVIYTYPFIFFSVNDKKLKLKRMHDSYLFHLKNILLQMHHTYFANSDDHENDIRKVYSHLRRNILNGKRISFSGIIDQTKPPGLNHFFKYALKMGAVLVDSIDEETFCLISDSLKNTKKLRQAKKLNIPIVHPRWIDFCIMYSICIPIEPFIGIQKIDNSDEIDLQISKYTVLSTASN